MLEEKQIKEILFLCNEFDKIKTVRMECEQQLFKKHTEDNLNNFISAETKYFLLLHKLGHLSSVILPLILSEEKE